MNTELFSTNCERRDRCRARKASWDSTSASCPYSTFSTWSDDAVDTRPTTCTSECFSSENTWVEGDALDEHSEIDCLSQASSTPTRVVAGMCIRVWRRTSPSSSMEWAEVVQRKLSEVGDERVICETLHSEVFEFSPWLVEQGCDDVVEHFEIAHEGEQKRRWREEEVARLHAALSAQGRLGKLSPANAHRSLGYTASASQFYVKATVTSAIAPEKRREVQDNVQKQLMLNLRSFSEAKCCVEATSRPQVSVAGDEPPMKRWLQSMKTQLWKKHSMENVELRRNRAEVPDTLTEPVENLSNPEERPDEHIPEHCAECIRRSTWCCGDLHSCGITARLDGTVSQMFPLASWSACEAGVQTEVEHDGVCILLQIRPRLFFVTDTDAFLFGQPNIFG